MKAIRKSFWARDQQGSHMSHVVFLKNHMSSPLFFTYLFIYLFYKAQKYYFHHVWRLSSESWSSFKRVLISLGKGNK